MNENQLHTAQVDQRMDTSDSSVSRRDSPVPHTAILLSKSTPPSPPPPAIGVRCNTGGIAKTFRAPARGNVSAQSGSSTSGNTNTLTAAAGPTTSRYNLQCVARSGIVGTDAEWMGFNENFDVLNAQTDEDRINETKNSEKATQEVEKRLLVGQLVEGHKITKTVEGK